MNQKQKILCVLYDDPVSGYPTQYARESIPELKQYPDGQSMPSPAKIDFNPGDLLGSISGGLGLKKFLEDQGHEFVVTSDKDVQNSVFDQEIVDAVVHHLKNEKLPTVPRSIRHKYMSAFLLAATEITKMDKVVPKVSGVESWELTFKLCRRWGYKVKNIPKKKPT